MSEQSPQYGNHDRYFLVGGKLNGGDFGITLKSKRHVSVKDVLAYFLEFDFIKPTERVDLKITSIYEFPDEADFNDYLK